MVTGVGEEPSRPGLMLLDQRIQSLEMGDDDPQGSHTSIRLRLAGLDARHRPRCSIIEIIARNHNNLGHALAVTGVQFGHYQTSNLFSCLWQFFHANSDDHQSKSMPTIASRESSTSGSVSVSQRMSLFHAKESFISSYSRFRFHKPTSSLRAALQTRDASDNAE